MLEAAHTKLGKLSKYQSVSKKDWQPDMSSHVVLAACQAHQAAQEMEGADNCWNGVFTQALMETLKSDDLKEGTTYLDLVYASKMPPKAKQTPIVAGNMYERLWYQSNVLAVPDLDQVAPITTPIPTPQPEMSTKFPPAWSNMHVWLLSVVGVSVVIGLIAWLHG
ncbi:hypothetical protein IW262DRAFT_1397131 [Armillaria fumosa]|nr:hypothetical protein IW262DRAFT_1397131 [Armillaria fumosa]